ncbi:RHS repeat-associated core domain-containing protein [Mesorhizobium sp. M1B.F.Ca.ET.045.04.1.1]|uniref:RHS repeat-associated core domain-containing protein n=1 Tax=Mesorhizobium sp. M1B.F.Ca.ET.045.04.1.1 TaxID=2493673 RepID=UPI00167493B9|nr:RHS repeat-associated core domain-containing protein [Mesorhizobium sp. M1B.F.Ca.ET.045.04.1.1]
MVTDGSGAITEATNHATYGERLNTGFQTQKSYIGERFDPETGLLYLNARYMDPVLGRFISPDDWESCHSIPQFDNVMRLLPYGLFPGSD